MDKLILKFEVLLQRDDLPKWKAPMGPTFREQAPNREYDAIVLDTGQPNTELKVWFDPINRLSLLSAEWGHEVDVDDFGYPVDDEPTILAVEGGPLRGRLTMTNVSEEILAVLHEHKVYSRAYVTFGEQLVNMIGPSVSRLIDLLRTHYGQYWLRPLLRWESTDDPAPADYDQNVNDYMRYHEFTGESLGAYCSQRLSLEYTLDSGATWTPFYEPLAYDYFYSKDFYDPPPLPPSDYLSPKDLKELGDWVRGGYEPTPAARAIALAQELHDQQDWTAALIMSVTAFDVAWGEFRKSIKSKDRQIQEKVSQFLKQHKDRRSYPSVGDRVEFAFKLNGDLVQWYRYTTSSPLDLMKNAIKLRHDVVHEGKVATGESGTRIWCLIVLAATLLDGPRYRFVRPLRLPLTYAGGDTVA